MASFIAPLKETFVTTGNGIAHDCNGVTKSYAIQVVGIGASATSWSVDLEASLDNTNFDTILTHDTTTGNGKIFFSGSDVFPSRFIRVKVNSLSLGSATGISVIIVAVK